MAEKHTNNFPSAAKRAKTAAQKALALAAGFSLLLPAAALAQSAAGQNAQAPFARITVEASGEQTAKPDMALLQISVSHEGKTPGAAAEQTKASAQSLLAALKAAIPEKDIQSNGLSVSAVYPQAESKQKPSKQFRAEAAFNVTLRDTAKLGALLDTALKAGATGLSDISWSNSDTKPLYAAARRKAVAEAFEKIKTYAQAAGVSPGHIMQIEETSDSGGAPRFYAARAKAAAAMEDMAEAPPIAPGEESYSVRITVTQELLNKTP